MLLRWLFQITLYHLSANALVCEPMLGTTIRTSDCQVALNLFISKLKLTPPYNHFETTPNTFARHHPQDARYDMPQGAQFESCGIAVDTTANANNGAVATWQQLLISLTMLVDSCAGGSTPGLGGSSSLGPFVFLVVDPGQGMRNVVGTCMHPRPPQNQNILWQLAERLCGFQAMSSFWPVPDRTQLPPSPALFSIAVTFGSGGTTPYRAGGQWVWNGDVWSPSIGNPFTRRLSVQQMWLLVTKDVQHRIQTPPAFSRTIPRAMAAVWAHLPNGVQINYRGAWGSTRGSWVPLAGDISNIELRLQAWDWVLVEFGNAADLDERAALTSPQQPRATPPHRLLASPVGANLGGSTGTTTTAILQPPREIGPYRFISFQGYRIPSTTTSRLAQTTSALEEQAAVGLLELAGFRENQSAPAGSSSMEEPSAEFRSPGSIPRPMPAAGENMGLDSAPAVGDDDYPTSSNLGLSPGFFLPFQAAHPSLTASPQPGSGLIPQHPSGSRLNAWMDEVPSGIQSRPSKRPRPNP